MDLFALDGWCHTRSCAFSEGLKLWWGVAFFNRRLCGWPAGEKEWALHSDEKCFSADAAAALSIFLPLLANSFGSELHGVSMCAACGHFGLDCIIISYVQHASFHFCRRNEHPHIFAQKLHFICSPFFGTVEKGYIFFVWVGSEVIGLPGGMDNQELWPLIEAWGVVLAPQKQWRWTAGMSWFTASWVGFSCRKGNDFVSMTGNKFPLDHLLGEQCMSDIFQD